MHWVRAMAGAAALVFAAAACSATGRTSSADGVSDPAGAPRVLEPVTSSAREDGPSALKNPADSRLPAPAVDVRRIRSGGPPPDGIPAIDVPTFQPASAVDWLADTEAVLALELNGQSRAYPVQVLIWHEIVNDTIDGDPIAVTYCPLCNSALAYRRQLGARVVTFGTFGQPLQLRAGDV